MAAKDSIFGLSYAPSSYGKTVDAGYAFPNALFICRTGGEKSIISTCGYTPTILRHTLLPDATKALKDYAGKFDAIVVDEFDFLVEDTLRAFDQRYTGYKVFGELKKAVFTFRNTAREINPHVWITCLERGPKRREDGTLQRGGPSLPSDLPEKVPAMCDLVLRGSRDPLRRPWPGIYRVDVNSTEWVGKDRDSGTPDPAPMNLGEILRFNGYDLSRHASAPWQAAFVQRIHEEMLNGSEDEEGDTDFVEKWYPLLLTKGIPVPLAKWTIRDALDRTLLTRAKRVRDASFY